MNLNLRTDGRVERLCEHGIGHTIAVPLQALKDIDAKRGLIRRGAAMNAWFTHGCDGCCGLKDLVFQAHEEATQEQLID